MNVNKYSLEKQINVVIIGTGKAGDYHLDALKFIQNVNVVGVMNSGRKDPVELRKKYQINNWIRNENDFNQLKKVDAIIVAVTTKQTVKLLPLLTKLNLPCLIEKPLGINPTESLEIMNKLESIKDLTFVGFNRRFYSTFLKAQDFIKKLGSPYSLHIDAPEPHSSLLMRGKHIDDVKNRLLLNTTHALDFFIFLLGKPININNFNNNSYRNGYKIDFMSFLEFDDNASGSFISHWASPGPWLFKIYGEDYQIILNLTRNKGEIFSVEFGNQHFEISNDDVKCKPGVLKQNYYFLKSVIDGVKAHPNLCGLQEAHLNNKLAIDLDKN